VYAESAFAPVPGPPPEKMKRRWPIVIAVVVAVGALAAAGLVWHLSHRDDPKTVALPPLQQRSATADYLAGSGKVVVTFWRKTATPDAKASRTDCLELARELSALTTPTQVEQRASAVPDPGIRDAALAHLHAVGRYLAACGHGEDASAAADEVHYDAVVLGRLLRRAGVR
jgi:hypothetical protein